MDIDTLDLNLLRIFDALIRTRNVTSAGEAVGLSQPAVSYALAKLRTLTGDELFVRSRGGMEPTPRAIHMGVPVRQVLDMIRREVFQTDHFIPSEAERVFTALLNKEKFEQGARCSLLFRLSRTPAYRDGSFCSVRTH